MIEGAQWRGVFLRRRLVHLHLVPDSKLSALSAPGLEVDDTSKVPAAHQSSSECSCRKSDALPQDDSGATHFEKRWDILMIWSIRCHAAVPDISNSWWGMFWVSSEDCLGCIESYIWYGVIGEFHHLKAEVKTLEKSVGDVRECYAMVWIGSIDQRAVVHHNSSTANAWISHRVLASKGVMWWVISGPKATDFLEDYKTWTTAICLRLRWCTFHTPCKVLAIGTKFLSMKSLPDTYNASIKWFEIRYQ